MVRAAVRGCVGAWVSATVHFSALAQVTLQPRYRAACPLRESVQRREFCGRKVSAIGGVLQVVLAFHQRPARNVEEHRKLAVGATAEAFGDIARP